MSPDERRPREADSSTTVHARSAGNDALARRLLLVPVTIAVLFFALPLLGLLARVDWSRVGQDLASWELRSALHLSLVTSTCAAGLVVVLGLPLAVWLAGHRGPTRRLVRVLVLLPMVLPPVVGGGALLFAYGRRGIAGGLLDALGLELAFTAAAVVLAQTWVALPFFVLTLEGGLRSFDRRYAEVAETLGATPAFAFRTVVLPMVAPSLVAGAVVAWARALGEFGATLTFAGNFEGRTRTMPLAIFDALEERPATAPTLSLVLIALSVLVLFALRDRWLRPA